MGRPEGNADGPTWERYYDELFAAIQLVRSATHYNLLQALEQLDLEPDELDELRHKCDAALTESYEALVSKRLRDEPAQS